MRKIESIEVFPVLLPVIETFQFASGSAGGDAPHVFVKVTDSEGEVGWGEGRPVPQWSYETLQTVETTIRDYLAPALLGLPVTDRWGCTAECGRQSVEGRAQGNPSPKPPWIWRSTISAPRRQGCPCEPSLAVVKEGLRWSLATP